MRKQLRLWQTVAGCLPFLLAGCTADTVVHPGTDDGKVFFAVDDFESAGATRTETYLDATTRKYKVRWTRGDAVGIFPYEGWQEPFLIPDDQVDQSSATFDGGYWALKEGLTYNAYYPFSEQNFFAAKEGEALNIPVSYGEQKQDGSTYGVGAYDYTYSDWQTAPASGSVTFAFHHIGALVIFHVTYPASADYTRLALSTGDAALIPTEGAYDLTYNKDKTPGEGEAYVKIPFVADEASKASSLGMTLTDCNATEGDKNTFYMMVPPVDLSSATLTFVMTDSNDKTYSCELAPTNFESGKKYEYTIAPIELGDITADAWTEVPVKDLPGLETE